MQVYKSKFPALGACVKAVADCAIILTVTISACMHACVLAASGDLVSCDYYSCVDGVIEVKLWSWPTLN